MGMNGNLSTAQLKQNAVTSKIGAMPINTKYDGPAPLDPKGAQGVKQPGTSIHIPKPGFF